MSDKTLELQIRIAAEEAARIVAALKGDVKGLADEANKFAKNEGANLNRTFKESEAAAKDAANSIDGIKNSIGQLAEAALATKAVMFVKDMGAFALETADNFQTMKNQFGILLGDMQAGAGLFNEIKAFNDVTPFDLDTLTQATNVLVSAKVPLADLQSQLTKFGDLSQGNSQKLTSYINAFSQAAAKGKADMQVLNTYLHQGVPILDALANNFGVTTAEIIEMSSQGKISFADFSQALDDLTAAGGQYFGGMELASQSLAAMQEGLKEATNTLAASYGELLMPAALGIIDVFTKITNAINESPIGKAVFTAAIVTLTGLLAGMAVKTWGAYAAKMALNFAQAAGNPILLASTIAVAGLAAGYVAFASTMNKSANETDALARAQRRQRDATAESRQALEEYRLSLQQLSLDQVIIKLGEAQREVDRAMAETARRAYIPGRTAPGGILIDSDEQRQLEIVKAQFRNLRTAFINEFTDMANDRRIAELRDRINIAQLLMGNVEITQGDRSALENIIQNTRNEISKLSGDMKKTWQQWFGEITKIDPASFGNSGARAAEIYAQNFERELTTQTTIANALGEQLDISKILRGRQADVQKALIELFSIDPSQTTAVFEITDNSIKKLIEDYNELGRQARQADFNKTIEELTKKINDLGKSERELAYEAELAKLGLEDQSEEAQKLAKAMNTLTIESTLASLSAEVKNLTQDQYDLAYATLAAAGASDEQLEKAKEMIEALRDAQKEITKEPDALQKARESVKNWQQELSDSLLTALMDLKKLSDETSVILSELSLQLINLSINAGLSGFEEFGRALGQGKDGIESMTQALTQMAQQILKQLPMMFLQAGLQLLAQSNPLGWAFIAAAGSSAIISGYVDGVSKTQKEASKHAQGGVFDEYGKAARTFAAGGAFTNQIVSAPTYFAHGGGFGLMGEAGPEAIMPLTRMSNGSLGVQTAGSQANVTVNVLNYSGAEVSEEKTENADGSVDYEIIIGEAFNKHIASGKADRIMGGRYGLRASGV